MEKLYYIINNFLSQYQNLLTSVKDVKRNEKIEKVARIFSTFLFKTLKCFSYLQKTYQEQFEQCLPYFYITF